MPRGDKSAYTGKQKRQAAHIEERYEDRGLGKDEAERRAWATVNKMTGGGKKSGSGRGKKTSTASAKKGGRKGGASTKKAGSKTAAKKRGGSKKKAGSKTATKKRSTARKRPASKRRSKKR